MSIFINEKIKYFILILITASDLYSGTSGKIAGNISDENGNPLDWL